VTGAHAQDISGIVRNEITGLPLQGARVTLDGTSLSAVTGNDGRFLLRGAPRGEWTLVVQRVGIDPIRRRLTIAEQGITGLELIASPAAHMIAPVVVTGTGESGRVQHSSVAIDAVDGQDIRETRASHPSGIMNRIPGVHITALTGEGHSTAIRQPITTKPVYLYLEDGIPTRSTGFFNHNALYEVNLPQAGGIEVLKGPGTALYGSDAIGGVVNALTRPAPATPGIEGNVEGGSYGYRRLMLTGGGWVGGSGFRLDLNLTDSDGWRENAPYNRLGGTVRWDAPLGGGITVKTVLAGSTVDQFDVPSLNAQEFELNSQLNKAPIAYRRADALRLSSAFEKSGDAWLLSVTPYARYNTMELLPQWQLTFDQQTWDTRNTSLGIVTRYRHDIGKLRMIAGVDAETSPGSFVAEGITAVKSQADSRVWSSYAFREHQYDYDVTYRSVSPYIHTEFTPLSRVRVDLGARYDASSYDYETHLPPVNTGAHRRPENTTVSYSRLSPKAGIVIDVLPNTSVTASYREGFRTPSQGQVFQQNSAANTVDLKPVKVRSYELGLRGEIAGRVLYSISAYDMSARDDILTFTTPANTREAVNAGETSHRGVEVGVGAALSSTLRADAAYSQARHEYVHWVPRESANPDQRIDYSGNLMEAAPRDLANLVLTWTPAFLKGGRTAVEWSLLGRYALDPANTHFTSGYSLINAHLNYKVLPSVELFVRALNLADREYAELMSYDAFQGVQYNAGAPRSVFLGLRYGWQK
jgi:outer membrane receptor protein involved in Fe transport